jgi:hypothetical protein
MFRFLLALIFAILAVALSPAESQTNIVGGGMIGDAKAAGAPTYTGPGDIVSFSVWWGLRCYKSTYAGSVVDITDTATGSTTGTRLQCASGGTISAVVSASACTFVTGNACSPLATTCAVACNIARMYDQTLGALCGGTCDLQQNTNSLRPTYLTSCIGSLPCSGWSGAANTEMVPVGIGASATNAPNSISYAGERTGAFTTSMNVIIDQGNQTTLQYNNTANTMQFYMSGTTINATVSDSAFHAVQAIDTATGSASVNVDGTATTGATGASTWKLGGAVGSRAGTNPLTADMLELGVLQGAVFTGPQITSLNSNQHTYWGF